MIIAEDGKAGFVSLAHLADYVINNRAELERLKKEVEDLYTLLGEPRKDRSTFRFDPRAGKAAGEEAGI